jgi:hypothetical protein
MESQAGRVEKLPIYKGNMFSRWDSFGVYIVNLDNGILLSQNILKDGPSQALRYNIEKEES